MDFVVLPGPFSGGSAPLLQQAVLDDVPFPDLSNFFFRRLLYQSPHLSCPFEYRSFWIHVTRGDGHLHFRVEKLHLEFRSPHFLPDWESRRPRPPTRSVQTALNIFSFVGLNEYLEDSVTQIDVPQLRRLSINFDKIIFDTSQFFQFIYREAGLKAPNEAVNLFIGITCAGSHWELSPMVQVCASLSHPLSSVESLYIYKSTSMFSRRQDLSGKASGGPLLRDSFLSPYIRFPLRVVGERAINKCLV